MQADELAHGACRRETVEYLSDHLTAARDRGNRLVVGEVVEDQFDLVVDRRGQQPESLRARGLGRKGRVVSVARQGAVHGPDHGAESLQGVEERARRGREQRAPELPSVARIREEALRDAEGRGHRGARVTPPPAELRDIREPAAAEEPEQLELGVHAWLEPAIELDDQLVVDDHRRVRLLDTERTDVYPGRVREPPEGRELDSARVGGDELRRRPRARSAGPPRPAHRTRPTPVRGRRSIPAAREAGRRRAFRR